MNKSPFLSSMFSKLAQDPEVIKAINQSSIRKQLNATPEMQKAFAGLGANPAEDVLNKFYADNGITQIGAPEVSALASNPWNNGNAGTLLKGYASAHPLKTAAGVGLGMANLSGLMDNDYWGGQAIGALAGGLGSKFLGSGFSPMITMAGGALGSLFDKLRQKQAEQNQKPQYYR